MQVLFPGVRGSAHQFASEYVGLSSGNIDARDPHIKRLRKKLSAHGALWIEHTHVGPPRALDDAYHDATRASLFDCATSMPTSYSVACPTCRWPSVGGDHSRIILPASLDGSVKICRKGLRAHATFHIAIVKIVKQFRSGVEKPIGNIVNQIRSRRKTIGNIVKQLRSRVDNQLEISLNSCVRGSKTSGTQTY